MTEDYIYEMPNGTTNVQDVLFNLPNQYTDGAYINIWLTGVFGCFFIGSLFLGNGAKESSLFAAFGTFITTFLLTIAGFAGGNQLIPATVILLITMVVNYMQSRRGF